MGDVGGANGAGEGGASSASGGTGGTGSSSGTSGTAVTAIKRIIAFAIIVVAWVALDQWAKGMFADVSVGQVVAGPFLGLFDFRLVHNTGAAWGIFSGNPGLLGAFSVAVCAVLVIYFLWNAKSINAVQTVGIALIAAGGIGNAIDRFAQGYVVDFIETTFIDFPVFNVADIGVTCGVVILMIGLAVEWRHAGEGEA